MPAAASNSWLAPFAAQIMASVSPAIGQHRAGEARCEEIAKQLLYSASYLDDVSALLLACRAVQPHASERSPASSAPAVLLP